ncbi:hypothetical protein ACYOEI_16450 [Singulisphaera rosea]
MKVNQEGRRGNPTVKISVVGLHPPDGSGGMILHEPEAQASELLREKSKKIHSVALRARMEEMPLKR